MSGCPGQRDLIYSMACNFSDWQGTGKTTKFNFIFYRAVITHHNTQHFYSWVCLTELRYQQVNLPLDGIRYWQSNKFNTSIKIKATCDSKLNDSLDQFGNLLNKLHTNYYHRWNTKNYLKGHSHEDFTDFW